MPGPALGRREEYDQVIRTGRADRGPSDNRGIEESQSSAGSVGGHGDDSHARRLWQRRPCSNGHHGAGGPSPAQSIADTHPVFDIHSDPVAVWRSVDGDLQPQPGHEQQSTSRRLPHLLERPVVRWILQRWPHCEQLAHAGRTLGRERLERCLHSQRRDGRRGLQLAAGNRSRLLEQRLGGGLLRQCQCPWRPESNRALGRDAVEDRVQSEPLHEPAPVWHRGRIC